MVAVHSNIIAAAVQSVTFTLELCLTLRIIPSCSVELLLKSQLSSMKISLAESGPSNFMEPFTVNIIIVCIIAVHGSPNHGAEPFVVFISLDNASVGPSSTIYL